MTRNLLILMLSVTTATADHATDIREFFIQLSSERMDLVDAFYAAEVHFIDPAGEITGRARLKRYYAHLYGAVTDINFAFPEIRVLGNEAFATWRMTLSSPKLRGGKPVVVDGISHIRFDGAGQAVYHRDYFDLGSMIYEHVPVLGFCLRYIKKRLNPNHRDTP